MLPTRLDTNLETIRDEVKPWSIPDKHALCESAQKFSEWAEEHIGDDVNGENATPARILIAKVKLTDRYRFFRRQVNNRCRDRVNKRGHICIFHVWDQFYARLEEIEGGLPDSLSLAEIAEYSKIKKEEDNDQPFATLVALREEF